MKWFFRGALLSPVVAAFVVGGILLMTMALYFNVNPVCSGAVHDGLQDYPLVLALLGTATIPAMYCALMLNALSGHVIDSALPYILTSLICQVVLYFLLGILISRAARLIRKMVA